MPTQLRSGRFYGRTLRNRRIADLVLVDSFHPAGSRLPRHSHERAYFCLNRGGMYTEAYGRRMRTCQPGPLVFHPPGEAHSEAHDSALTSFKVEVGPGWLMCVCEFAGPLDQPADFGGDDMVATAFQLFHECRRAVIGSGLA